MFAVSHNCSYWKTTGLKKPIKQKLFSIYFDSPVFILRQHRVSLRTRKTGDQWSQTIKSGGTVHTGLHQHNEWEYFITDKNLDFSQIVDQNLKKFFADTTLRQSLRPIFETDFYRTTYLLEPSEGFKLEFCLDEGNIIANGRTEPICEIELELKSGDASQLLQFSEILQKNCLFPLIPENTNKAVRGYALLSQ